MDHHSIIREEVEAAKKAVADLEDSIAKLTAQQERICCFIEAMEIALSKIPVQLEFKFEQTEENAILPS